MGKKVVAPWSGAEVTIDTDEPVAGSVMTEVRHVKTVTTAELRSSLAALSGLIEAAHTKQAGAVRSRIDEAKAARDAFENAASRVIAGYELGIAEICAIV